MRRTGLCRGRPLGYSRCARFALRADAARCAARCLARLFGVLGSNLEYVENLAEHFVVLGIEDAMLFALRDRAREIAAG